MTDASRDLPPLDWIRVFETAARHLNFSAAASELGLTQAAVSQTIRKLELRIGAQLFNRHPRGVSLSTQGEAWLPPVQLALRQLGRSTADLFAAPRRKVVIAAPASMTGLWLIPRLARISQALPQLQIQCETIHQLSDAARIDADFELRYGAGLWPGRAAVPVFREALLPMAAPELMTPGRAWRDLPLIATSGPRPGWQEWVAARGGAAPLPRLRFDTFMQSLQAALAGAGVLLGSLPLAAAALEEGRLVLLADQPLGTGEGYWITWPETAAPFREKARLLDLLLAPARAGGGDESIGARL
ncbi:LysR family transcriptional regulator [Pseudogemmobacter faecipullorum]|uniref:LysR family transcriptional regulator n=1 Tax=Pseudogemmobacter faecipullorum TaxID=2755041 RepID=A0ABS8CRH0_9RHOB|nr:LysR family transcriptional regulator [Pseudogemmobacter faecipullorum]MCB5412000.1 LysR family transcriptional regulator [Pseudogemmobacter faecipullorum]